MTCLRDSFNLKVTQVCHKISKNEDKTNSRVSDPHTSHPQSRYGVACILVKLWLLLSRASDQTGK